MAVEGCYKCMKYILFLFNFLVLVSLLRFSTIFITPPHPPKNVFPEQLCLKLSWLTLKICYPYMSKTIVSINLKLGMKVVKYNIIWHLFGINGSSLPSLNYMYHTDFRMAAFRTDLLYWEWDASFYKRCLEPMGNLL